MVSIKFVCHKTHDINYGQFYEVNGVGYYKKWKNVPVNQTKSAPKICVQQQFDIKETPDDFWEHFKEITYAEWCGIDTIHYLSVK